MLFSDGPYANIGSDEATMDESSNGAEKAQSVGFIHPDVVRAIHAVLVELDADLDGLIAEAGLDPRLFEDSGPVPYTAIGRLLARAAAHTRFCHLGLLVGQRTTLTSLGLLGRLLRNSASVGDALRALEAYACMRDRGAVVGLGVYGDTALLSYAPHEPAAEGTALHLERALATVTNILRGLCGAEWAPLEVLLPRSAPRDVAPYACFFRAPVRFDQEVAALVFPAELLKQPITGEDPVVRQRIEARLHRLEADQPASLTDKLREYLQTAVTRERCKAERVARMRLVNRRTLSRRLRAEGTTFKKLANEAHFAVAKQLLVDTSMSLTEISGALNFSEPAAFTHAFRRWSGTTPSAWRRANRPEPMRH
ncbi:AraC family transcriptional regulator [Methylobacterium phyllosphaerae]